MRVLAVSTWLPTDTHPTTGTFVVKDAQAIASLGHDVALVHLVPPAQADAPTRGELGGMPVTRVPMATQRPADIAAAGRTLRAMAAKADLLHTMAFSSLLPTAGWRCPVPWVHTEHWSGLTSPQTLPLAWRLVLPSLTPLLRAPDVVTAVCDYLAAPIRGLRRDRPTLVIPCIVPAPPGGPPDRPTDETLDLVSVGGLVPGKDPLTAVETVAELRRRGHPARIRFVGRGELAEAVQERAGQLGIADHVDLAGTLDRQGVLAELARADLFLGPTRGDNFFVSCAEALVSGRPVVVGATGGQGEYIDPVVGLTVARQDPTAYADAVEQVLEQTRELSAGQISDTVGDRFQPEVVAQGYQDAYDQAVEVHRGER